MGAVAPDTGEQGAFKTKKPILKARAVALVAIQNPKPVLLLFASPLTLYASRLFYDFVRSRQHVGRNRQADLLGRLQIDNELKLCWLLHGQVGGLRAF